MGKINTNNYPNRPVSDYQDDDMFILQDNGGETYTTNVGDIKNLADSRIKLEGVQVNGTDLPISGKKVNVDISGKTDLSVIAYTFNSEMGYFKGAYVTYNGKLYEFIQEHTGAWNPSHVREIRASGQYVRTGNGGYNNGDRATCEGYMTKASGNYSHAEGRETQAVGECTHAEGRETIANSDYQHVEGKYNVADNESKYIHIIGNGTDDNNRSNAMTLDWDGNLEVSGDVENGNGEKISDKADKVTNATSGHLAGLDANGNLTDSGVSLFADKTVGFAPVVTCDNAIPINAKKVTAKIVAQQDLHGYDAPWVGGSGKNKLPLVLADIKANNTNGTWNGNVYSINGGTIEVLVDNADNVLGFKANGTFTGTVSFSLYAKTGGSYPFENANYILNGCPQGGSGSTYKFDVIYRKNASDYNLVVDYGASATADFSAISDADSVTIRIVVYAGTYSNVVFYPMIRLSTVADATFAPYSNICPISGFSAVEVTQTGKNILSLNRATVLYRSGTMNILSDNSFNITRMAYGASNIVNIICPVEHNTDYSFDFVGTSGIYKYGIRFLNEMPSTWQNISNETKSGNSGSYNYIAIGFEISTGTTAEVETVTKLQLEYSSTPTAFEPYTGQTHTLTLSSTNYGGSADNVGNETADYGFAVFDGSEDESWLSNTPAWSDSCFAINNMLVGAKSVSGYDTVANILSNQGVAKTPAQVADRFSSNHGVAQGDGTRLFVNLSDDINTVEKLRTFLASNPLQVCYELATPTTASIDPVPIQMLKGKNVFSADSGDTQVEYTYDRIGDLADRVKALEDA